MFVQGKSYFISQKSSINLCKNIIDFKFLISLLQKRIFILACKNHEGGWIEEISCVIAWMSWSQRTPSETYENLVMADSW